MSEYIDREELLKKLCTEFLVDESGTGARFKMVHEEDIVSAPAADVAPVVHGRWIWDIGSEYRCEICGRDTVVDEVMGDPIYNYCPYCGAKMEWRGRR